MKLCLILLLVGGCSSQPSVPYDLREITAKSRNCKRLSEREEEFVIEHSTEIESLDELLIDTSKCEGK